MADTVPFFSDYRLIIVENSGFFKTSGHETLAEYMKHIPETTCIVFVESEVDKRSKLFKAVSSSGYAANLTMPGDKQLMLWLGGIVKRENKLIQEQTMQYLSHHTDRQIFLFTGRKEILRLLDEKEILYHLISL